MKKILEILLFIMTQILNLTNIMTQILNIIKILNLIPSLIENMYQYRSILNQIKYTY